MVRNGKNRKNENYYIYYLKYSFPGGYRGNAYEKIFLNIHYKKDLKYLPTTKKTKVK
jgi:hypothetical protein